MSTASAEIHDELRTVARDLLADTAPRPDGSPPVAADWTLLARSGWLGLEVPEALDGSAASFAEVAVILHEMGRAATLSPYLGSVVLGAGALDLVEQSAGRDELMRAIASGSARVAVAMTTADDTVDAGRAPFRLERAADGFVLDGDAPYVPDAPDADRLLLLALDPDARPVIVQLEPGSQGLAVVDVPLLDATRRHGRVIADRLSVPNSGVWNFAADPAAGAQQLFDRAALAIACDSLGLAEAMQEATVEYVGARQQFGRPIGSFQAVKHACADMLVQLAIGRELLTEAVDQVCDPHCDVGETGRAVSMAASFVCDAAVDVVGSAMQLHGGIGYTWESGVHVYLKRATLNRALFGSPAAHRSRLARRYREDSA